MSVSARVGTVGNGVAAPEQSAEAGKVEVDGDGLAFRGKDLDGGEIGGEETRGKLKVDRSTGEHAPTFSCAEVIGLPGESIRRELVLAIKDMNAEVPPETRRAKPVAERRSRAGACGCNDEGAIGLREKNFDADDHRLIIHTMIFFSLLRTGANRAARLLDQEGEGRQEGDRINVRAGLWRSEIPCVAAQEAGHGFVMALAEEIGFADGLVG